MKRELGQVRSGRQIVLLSGQSIEQEQFESWRRVIFKRWASGAMQPSGHEAPRKSEELTLVKPVGSGKQSTQRDGLAKAPGAELPFHRLLRGALQKLVSVDFFRHRTASSSDLGWQGPPSRFEHSRDGYSRGF